MDTREKRQQLANQVKYNYFNISNTGGIATLAYVVDQVKLYYGVAICCPTDQFVRAEGKSLAHKRLFEAEGKDWILWPTERDQNYDAKKAIIKWFLEDRRPEWINLTEVKANGITYRAYQRKTNKKPKKLGFLQSIKAKLIPTHT